MKYRFPNPTNNPFINEYNKIVTKYENCVQTKDNTLSLHHILPRSTFPEFKNDPLNHLYLPVMEHINIHYLLWLGLPEYCAAFWFCYVYFHKHAGYNIPDYLVERLKRDMRIYRRNKTDKEYLWSYTFYPPEPDDDELLI